MLMKLLLILLALGLILVGVGAAQDQDLPVPIPDIDDEEAVPDSNTAFFEGQASNYILYAPGRFRLIVEEAIDDGYSLAYVPEGDRYDSSGMMITALIYSFGKQRKKTPSYDEVVPSDTGDIRSHYGEDLTFEPLDSIVNASGESIRTYYLNDMTRFIPNIMVAYYDGGEEMLIFELTIAEGYPRFVAEEIFLGFLSEFKALKKGKLGD